MIIDSNTPACCAANQATCASTATPASQPGPTRRGYVSNNATNVPAKMLPPIKFKSLNNRNNAPGIASSRVE
ncbi:MAG: hypothetical protein ABII82_04735 [Verrucomicrobiota bacterium]